MSDVGLAPPAARAPAPPSSPSSPPRRKDDRPPGIERLIAGLVEPALVTYDDKSVRSLVACCFVATLRVYAPTAPYGPDQLMRGFELLIKEFHGISITKPRVIDERDENGQRLHWLLEGKQQASDRARRARTRDLAQRCCAPDAAWPKYAVSSCPLESNCESSEKNANA